MGLEGLLSEIKASTPKTKGAASMEKLGHLGFLQQLMKQHLGEGKADARGDEVPAKLIAEGVPLERAGRISRQRAQRPACAASP